MRHARVKSGKYIGNGGAKTEVENRKVYREREVKEVEIRKTYMERKSI